MHFTASICAAAMAIGFSAGASIVRAGAADEGVVLVHSAERAQLGGQPVSAGAAVRPGGRFVTEAGGEVELRAGRGQLFLGSSTVASLLDSKVNQMHVAVAQGTMKFSAPSSLSVEIETPAGILRGESGYAASGMVAIAEANTLMISAFGENLILDNDGEWHLLKAGHSYRIAVSDFDPGDPAAQSSSDAAPLSAHAPHKRHKLGLWLLGGGRTALATVEAPRRARPPLGL